MLSELCTYAIQNSVEGLAREGMGSFKALGRSSRLLMGPTKTNFFGYTKGHQTGQIRYFYSYKALKCCRTFFFVTGWRSGYCLITGSRAGLTRSFFTVKDVDGSKYLSYGLSRVLTLIIASLSWVSDTDLRQVISFNDGILVVDFMTSRGPLSFVIFPAGHGVAALVSSS